MAVVKYGAEVTLNTNKDITSVSRKRYGMSYPLTNNMLGGYFSKAGGIELIKNNITQLISTDRGERVMIPAFGTNVKKYLFEPMDQELFDNIKSEILETMALFAPYAQVLKLSVRPTNKLTLEGTQRIDVTLIVQIRSLDDIIVDIKTQVG